MNELSEMREEKNHSKLKRVPNDDKLSLFSSKLVGLNKFIDSVAVLCGEQDSKQFLSSFLLAPHFFV